MLVPSIWEDDKQYALRCHDLDIAFFHKTEICFYEGMN